MIPEETIAEILSRVDLVALVNEYQPLKKVGRNYVGRCLFHEERTPSFSVSPEKQVYHCFGCGAGGNVLTLVMHQEKLGFVEAVKWLADRVGVTLPQARRDEASPLDPLYEANAFARDHYQKTLKDPVKGVPAQRYLAQRGISPETQSRFQLGYAPPGGRDLLLAAQAQGMDPAVLLEAGLILHSAEGDRLYDRFRDRLIIPIHNPTGRPIAFGGRALGGEEPKYLNSPETPLFKKGETLFGLELTKGTIRARRAAVVVEGYFDLLALFQAGLAEVVAPLGTALTSGQARLLKRYCDEVYLLYDGDPAGLRATFRGGDELLRAGLMVKVALIPPGEDPDSLVRSEGADGIRRRLGQASDLLETKYQILAERLDLDQASSQRKAIQYLLSSIVLIPDPVTRTLYLNRTAERFHVPPEQLHQEAITLLQATKARNGSKVSTADEERAARRALPQKRLIQVMLHDSRWIGRAREDLELADFSDPVYATIYRHLLDLLPKDPDQIKNLLFTRLPVELHPTLSALYAEPPATAPEEEFRGAVALLKKPHLKRQRILKLKQFYEGASVQGLLEEFADLVQQEIQLEAQRSGGPSR